MEPDSYPDRLIKEAQRNGRRLEAASYGAIITAGSLFLATVQSHGVTLQQGVKLLGAVLGIPISVLLARRQRNRARWLANTERWWERLDEMPRIEPFPKLVDFVELQLLPRLVFWRRRPQE